MPQTSSACSEGNATSSIQESEGIQKNHTKANCLAQNADADDTGSDECDEWDEWNHVFAEQWQRHQYESYCCEAGSDPRGHLWVTWGVYLCAGKPPLADIILSHPPDLT